MKAKSGRWIEDPFIIIDEICNGKNYYINGWTSANYWHLTDQIPFMFDVFTINKQGIKILLNTKIKFHLEKESAWVIGPEIKEDKLVVYIPHNFNLVAKL